MNGERWLEILRSSPRESEGYWIVLPENGWGALVAYFAGPGRARPHESSATQRVEVTEDRGGVRTVRQESMTDEDFRSIQDSIAEELANLDITAPPCTWWEVELPSGVDSEFLAERLNAAMGLVEGPDATVERARRDAEALRNELLIILGAT